MSYHYDFDHMDDFLMAESIEVRMQKTRRLEYLHNLLVWMFCVGLCAFAGYGVGALARTTYLAIRLWVRR